MRERLPSKIQVIYPDVLKAFPVTSVPEAGNFLPPVPGLHIKPIEHALQRIYLQRDRSTLIISNNEKGSQRLMTRFSKEANRIDWVKSRGGGRGPCGACRENRKEGHNGGRQCRRRGVQVFSSKPQAASNTGKLTSNPLVAFPTNRQAA